MIYFMQPTDGGPVKIGTTEDLPARHKQLELQYRCPLAILATLPGGRDEEQELHARFAHLRFRRTEQFRPATELMEFIGRPLLVHPNPDTVEVIATTKAVKIDRALAAKTQMIATDQGVPMAEYISETLRAAVERDWGKMVRRVGGKD